MDDAPEYETPEETADRLKIPLRTLETWRYRGVGPPYVKVGQQIRYRRTDTDAWAAAKTVVPHGA